MHELAQPSLLRVLHRMFKRRFWFAGMHSWTSF
jgi:hypothetical protein